MALVLAAIAPQIAGNPPAPLADRLAPLRRGSVARMVTTIFLCGSGGLMFYSYLGPITAEFAGAGYQLRSFILLLVGVIGVGAVLLGGRITDAWGPRPARLVVIGGHSAALLGLAAFTLTGSRSGVAAKWGGADLAPRQHVDPCRDVARNPSAARHDEYLEAPRLGRSRPSSAR